MRRPAGQPCATVFLVGPLSPPPQFRRVVSARTAPIRRRPTRLSVKKRAPWPSPEEGSFRGPLAMNADELAAFISDSGITFPVLTPKEKAEAEAEAQWEAKLHKAIASGEIGRERPGRKPGKSKVLDADRVLAQVCLNDARGRSDKAKKAFIKQVCAQDHIKSDRAENRWYEVTEPDGRRRRVR
jgi:hypothetical protein